MRIAQYNILYVIICILYATEMCLLISCLVLIQLILTMNETCLVTCAVSLTCATQLMYAKFFPLIYPSTRIQANIFLFLLAKTVRWGQSCTFVVSEEEESMYMNVCIWGLVKEERKELLLGKVFQSIVLPYDNQC